jgi:hypothetical protein
MFSISELARASRNRKCVDENRRIGNEIGDGIQFRERCPSSDACLENGAAFKIDRRRQPGEFVERKVRAERIGCHVDAVDMMSLMCRLDR